MFLQVNIFPDVFYMFYVFVFSREKLQTAVSVAVQKYLTLNMQSTFEFIRSVLPVKKSIIIGLFPQIEAVVSEAEKYHRHKATSLR